MSLLPIAEARARILDGVRPTGAETVPLAEAAGRTLAEPVVAGRDQPPFRSSAMDGYAVRAADAADGRRLKLIGTSAAGRRFDGTVGAGETVRIFTGAPVPEGADSILIQEHADADGGSVAAQEPIREGANVRDAGIDFRAGDTLLEAGADLAFRQLALAAAAGAGTVAVRRRPLVAMLATGDELVPPGGTPGPDQIHASNGAGVAALLAAAGAAATDLRIAPDREDAIGARVESAESLPADILLTFGGVSVGEHDLVQAVLAGRGMTTGFWKVAMRPGKPLMFGRIGGMRVIGLPGNPVSSLVCAIVFVRPLVDALLGRTPNDPYETAVLGTDLPANGTRTHFMRARLEPSPGGGPPTATPLASQDSSLLSVLADSDCLLVRDALAPAAGAGEMCRFIPFR